MCTYRAGAYILVPICALLFSVYHNLTLIIYQLGKIKLL